MLKISIEIALFQSVAFDSKVLNGECPLLSFQGCTNGKGEAGKEKEMKKSVVIN